MYYKLITNLFLNRYFGDANFHRSIQITFSNGRRVITDYCTNLSVVIVEALICTQDWLRKSSLPIYDYDEVHDVLADDDLAIGNTLILVTSYF